MPSTVASQPNEGARPDDGGPRLAIVINCYNYAVFVEIAIRSVLDQATPECEVVVVDDGSTDGSWDVIQATGVRALRQSNGGQVAACRAGVVSTRAPFILFLDADDALKPGAIAEILSRLDPEVAKLQFPLTMIDAEGRILRQANPKLRDFRDKSAISRRIQRTGVYCSPPTSGNVFRRDVCALLADVDYERDVDGVMLFAAPFMGDVVSLSEPLGFYRLHNRNQSGIRKDIDAHVLSHQITRFRARHAHLASLLATMHPGKQVVPVEQTFYFRERMFCLELARNQPPGLWTGLQLIGTLITDLDTKEGKAPAYFVFYLLLALMPVRRARALLSERFELMQRPLPTLTRHLRFRSG